MMPYLSCKKIENDVYNFPTWQYCKYKDIFDSKILHIYFLSERFKDIFLDDRYNYKDIQLYLVSDAYGLAGKAESYEKYREIQEKLDKKDSLKVDRK